ncbi:MAG: type II secretion system protein N [Betaproteobacteria bacterium]
MAESRWGLAGALVGLAAGLVVFAPAAWLASAAAHFSNGQVQLVQARGTVWRGSGRLLLTGGSASHDARVLPGRLNWTLRPGLSAWRLRVDAECCAQQALLADVAPGWRTWRVDLALADSRWPAAVLAGLGAPWNTLQPHGQLRLRTEGFSLEWAAGRVQVKGSATLDALDLSSGLSTLRPIGSYRLQLLGHGLSSPPQLVLETLQGSLTLTGRGQWNGARWNFRGQASAAPEQELVLGNLLNIVGRRQGARSDIALD